MRYLCLLNQTLPVLTAMLTLEISFNLFVKEKYKYLKLRDTQEMNISMWLLNLKRTCEKDKAVLGFKCLQYGYLPFNAEYISIFLSTPSMPHTITFAFIVEGNG